jgi:hypothetical protein
LTLGAKLILSGAGIELLRGVLDWNLLGICVNKYCACELNVDMEIGVFLVLFASGAGEKQ